MSGLSINVALVGMTGVGKSTLVNILKGSEVAEVNNDSKPCTLGATCYEVVESGTTYHIWDTRGLNEASWRRFNWFPWVSLDANAQLKNLLSGGQKGSPEIDLVLLCVGGEKIGIQAHWEAYTKIPTSIKVAVVVTRMGDIGSSQWRQTCKDTAKLKGIELDTNVMEGVPKFRDLQEQKARDCRDKILALISRCC
ncbi:hypothetical protein PAXRUDRAFT_830900 [Paxillus rubicundulus Ve08.2h10]|uniref:G domain-containing protein n=1 Tax=Paxillus rubicundulus Ve08.2h10 TaxID=930991 RepID=A0A0D0E368_9AGAM|nr:hypothetical protein PAXRUDRAFT_830900 [Paxillus rubicundulus Ve08.2h10]